MPHGAIDGHELQDDGDRAAALAERSRDPGVVIQMAEIAEFVQEEKDGEGGRGDGGLQTVLEAGRIEQVDDQREVADLVLGNDDVHDGSCRPERPDVHGIGPGELHDRWIGPQIQRRARGTQDGSDDLGVLRQERLVFGEGGVVQVIDHEMVDRGAIDTEVIEQPAQVPERHVPLVPLGHECPESDVQDVDGGGRPERIAFPRAVEPEDSRELAELLGGAEAGEGIEPLALPRIGRSQHLDPEPPFAQVPGRFGEDLPLTDRLPLPSPGRRGHWE